MQPSKQETYICRKEQQGLRQARDGRAVSTPHFISRDRQVDGLYGKSRRERCIYKAGKTQDVTWAAGCCRCSTPLQVC